MRWFCALVLIFLQVGFAFEWEPFVFPEGDQRYTLELRMPTDGGETVAIIDIDIKATGNQYEVATSYAFTQTDLALGDLDDAALGGSLLSGLAFGPMMMFGPSFMMLPLLLGQEDIAVRPEPMLVMGMGRLTMSEEVELAGHTCVVVRFEPNSGEDFEFALAENLPFPCYSRYNAGNGVVEIRLIRAD